MAYSFTEYEGDGSTDVYSVPFLYIKKDDVTVTVEGEEVTFTWPTDATVLLDAVPDNGDAIIVRRTTARDARVVDFTNAALLDEATLDKDSNQMFFISQEAFDVVLNSLNYDFDEGAYDANSKRIINLADAIDATDAVNLQSLVGTVSPFVDACETAQTAAEAAQAAAETAQGLAETAQGLSETAQAASETAQGLSEDAKDASVIAQGLAEDAQAAAENAETNALSSEQDAQTAQGLAETAQGLAESAQASAESAESGAEVAEANAVTAKNQAVAAAVASEIAQGLSEDAQAASETAQGLAETAQTAAETAQTNAETAETNAETAQGLAETAQTAAETAETNAETAQTAAETAETNAETAQAKAEDWAQEIEDTEVEAGQYSALHHSAKANAQRVLAETAKTNAETAETNAQSSEDDAETAQGLAEAAQAAAETAEQGAEDDVALTNADVVTTHADVVLTGIDVGLTGDDVAITNQDAIDTAADVVLTGVDAADADADRILAETARTGAETAETNAETAQGLSEDARDLSEAAVAGAETAQGLSEDARDASVVAKDLAVTAQGDAETAETNAQSSEDDAETAQGLAESAQASAETAQAKAEDWAQEAEDVEVETGEYSALHHSAKAAGIVAAAFGDADFVQFNTEYSDGQAEGKLQWNAEDGTLEYGLPGGSVNLQVGQEHVVKVRNITGSLIPDGTPIYFAGSSANRPLIAKADATEEAKHHVEGMTTEDIADNSNGYVTFHGLVRGIDTDHLTEGADVWLDPATPGTMTDTRPTAPDFIVMLGHCIVKHADTGMILVHTEPALKVMENEDVLFDADPDDNEILKWSEANSRFELYSLTDLIDGGDTTLHDHDGISENSAARHAESHDIVDHDTEATGTELNTLTGGGDTTLHDHAGISENSAARHAQSHNIASHSDVSDATGANLETLTGGGDTTLHDHAGISENSAARHAASHDIDSHTGGDLELDSLVMAGSIELEDGLTLADVTGSGLIIPVTVDTAGWVGSLMCLAADGHWDLADADALATSRMVGISLATGTGAKKILLKGFVRNDLWGFTAGDIVYNHVTPGGIGSTAPSGSGDIVKVIGYAIHAKIIYVDPSPDFAEVL